MGIKSNLDVAVEETDNLEKAMIKKVLVKPAIENSPSKKVRENFYVDKEALDIIKKHVLLQKLKGEKISKSSLVNDWICTNAKKLEL
jgi:hypothetical protein